MLKRKRRSRVDLITDIVFIVLLILISLIALYPLWFVLIASVSDPLAIARGEVIFWPKDINFSAYKTLLDNSRIWIGYRNSLFYLFAGSFATLAVTLPAAYALSRTKLKGRKVINFLFIVSICSITIRSITSSRRSGTAAVIRRLIFWEPERPPND